MVGGTPRTRAQRSIKRRQYLSGQTERARLAALPDSWLSPSGRIRLMIALILLVAGAAAITAWRAAAYASDTASAQAFKDAPACASASAAAPGCVLNVPVVVVRAWTESSGGRNPTFSYYVDLSGPAPADGTLQLSRSYYLPTGDTGSTDALVWRGHVAALLDTGQEFDTPSTPAVLTDVDLNWLVAAALCTLALLAVLLSLLTSLRHSLWRYAVVIPPVIAAISFTIGAAAGYEPDAGHAGLYIGTTIFGFLAVISALVSLKVYRERRL